MALGDGNHKLPVKAETLRAIGKAPGQTIKVTLLNESGQFARAEVADNQEPVLHSCCFSKRIMAPNAYENACRLSRTLHRFRPAPRARIGRLSADSLF